MCVCVYCVRRWTTLAGITDAVPAPVCLWLAAIASWTQLVHFMTCVTAEICDGEYCPRIVVILRMAAFCCTGEASTPAYFFTLVHSGALNNVPPTSFPPPRSLPVLDIEVFSITKQVERGKVAAAAVAAANEAQSGGLLVVASTAASAPRGRLPQARRRQQ